MIVAYGDLHLGSDREWSEKVSKDVVDLIVKSPLNVQYNTLVLTGDVTDKAIVDGVVIDLLHSLFENLEYRETYICLGNHEGRIKNSQLTTTYDFLENPEYSKKLKSKVRIVKSLSNIQIEGMDVLFLPHIYNESTASLKDYESLGKEIIDKTYDLIIGHVTDSTLSFPSMDKVNIQALHSKERVMGHIHSGEYYSQGYLGSVVPNSVAENDFPRYYVTVGKTANGIVKEKFDLPKLLEYKEVVYPEPLYRTSAKTVVWTFTNCSDESMARVFYKRPEMFIRKCLYTSSIDKEEFKSMVGTTSSLQDFRNSLSSWVETKKDKLTPSLMQKIEYYSTV